jgi:hypothetical protein
MGYAHGRAGQVFAFGKLCLNPMIHFVDSFQPFSGRDVEYAVHRGLTSSATSTEPQSVFGRPIPRVEAVAVNNPGNPLYQRELP